MSSCPFHSTMLIRVLITRFGFQILSGKGVRVRFGAHDPNDFSGVSVFCILFWLLLLFRPASLVPLFFCRIFRFFWKDNTEFEFLFFSSKHIVLCSLYQLCLVRSQKGRKWFFGNSYFCSQTAIFHGPKFSYLHIRYSMVLT